MENNRRVPAGLNDVRNVGDFSSRTVGANQATDRRLQQIHAKQKEISIYLSNSIIEISYDKCRITLPGDPTEAGRV